MAPLISGARRDPEMARIAIDAYLAAPSLSPAPDLYHRVEAASRSLPLAILINDQSRVEAARVALVDLHRQAVTSRSQWWNTFDTLINNKRAARPTQAQRPALNELKADKNDFWSGRLAFILANISAAVGLGSIWKLKIKSPGIDLSQDAQDLFLSY